MLEIAEAGIAPRTEKAADLTGIVIVIDSEIKPGLGGRVQIPQCSP